MMGRTHAATGAILATVVQQALAQAGWVRDDPATQVTAVVLGAGAALYADLDTPKSTIAHTLAPVTLPLAKGVEVVAGGHRYGTHSLAGILVVTGLAWAVGLAPGWVVGLWLGVTVALGLTGLRLTAPRAVFTRIILVGGMILLFSVGTGVWTAWFDPRLLVWMTVTGGIAHVFLGDLYTEEGCALLWPFSRRRFRVARITTDTWVERYVVASVLFTAATLILLARTGTLPTVITWATTHLT